MTLTHMTHTESPLAVQVNIEGVIIESLQTLEFLWNSDWMWEHELQRLLPSRQTTFD